MTITTSSTGVFTYFIGWFIWALIRSSIAIASTQVPDPMGYLSILISYRARSRHRASRSSFLRAIHPHCVVPLTLQTRPLPLLAHTDVHMGSPRTTNSSVAALPHPLDPRCAVSLRPRRHLSCSDWTPSRRPFPFPNKIGRVMRLQMTTGHIAHTLFLFPSSCMYHYRISEHQRPGLHHRRLCHDCMTILRLRLPPAISLFHPIL